jgi:hypothetical protein
MYSLLNRVPARQLLLRHAPTFLGALAIAEMFYKWHSFLLETGGFLATWYLLDAGVSLVEKALGKGQSKIPPR